MKKKMYIVFCIIGFLFLSVGIYFFTKFKNVEVEVNDVIDKNKFIAYGTSKGVNIDLSNVDTSKVGEYKVVLKYLFFKYDLKVNVVDTTPPKLEVQNISKPKDYVLNINDFIVDISDQSKYDIQYTNDVDTSKFGEYEIDINAKDEYGNTTNKKAKLFIGWIKNEYKIEVGNVITINDLIYNKSDSNTVSKTELNDINNQREGIYYLTSTKDDITVQVKVEKTKDITPPELSLKKVTIYQGKKVNSINDFINKVSDKGSKVEVKMLTTINYGKTGEQKIEIEASDIDGNKTVKETSLNIVKDVVGPKISGLKKITANKGKQINYTSGVSAYDDNTGKCSFSVDSSGVNTSKQGTYYAVYTSVDSLGNKTTSKRVVVINHDENDTKALLKSVANKLSSDAEKIRDYVRNNIKYNTNWGGEDPIWYGLNNKSGNCYVHARIFDALLKLKGFTSQLIWTTDKTHYWNMVYLNGKWYHMDSTPRPLHSKYSIMTDEQRIKGLSGRNWDRSKWPKSE